MRTRDAAESLIKGWDAHERSNGRVAVVDFDCYPDGPEPDEISSRIEVYERLEELLEQARAEDNHWLIGRLRADLAYVSALLGQRLPLAEYVRETQGSEVVNWSDDYVERRREEAIEALASQGIDWGPNTMEDLEDSEGRLTPQESSDEIRAEADRFEKQVRELVDTDAPFSLSVEEVDIDAYWAYWMDGVGDRARLRINLRHAQFTKIRARQLALHEIHGHALQGASFYQRAQNDEVPWVRLLSVHGPQQILLEGLAQALPYFVTPDDEALIARTKLTHYQQLLRGRLHLMVNEQRPVIEPVNYLRKAVPFMSEAAIADAINDRAVNHSSVPISGPTTPASTGLFSLASRLPSSSPMCCELASAPRCSRWTSTRFGPEGSSAAERPSLHMSRGQSVRSTRRTEYFRAHEPLDHAGYTARRELARHQRSTRCGSHGLAE